MSDKLLDEILAELDGSVAEAEAELPEEAPAKTVRDVSVGLDIAKGLGSGVGRGLTGMLGVFGDVELLSRLASPKGRGVAEAAMPPEALSAMPYPSMARMIEQAEVKPTPPLSAPTALPTSQQVYGFLEDTVLPEGMLTYKPQTAGGRIAQMAGEFGSAGALGRAPVRGALMYGGIGAGAGGISEVSPTAGAAVGIASGIGAGTLASRRRGVESLLGDVVGEQTPAMLARAEQLQEQGRRIGVPLTAAESMESPSLRTLASSVAASPESAGIISQRLAGRKEAIPQAIERGILGVEEAPVDLVRGMGIQASEAASEAAKLQRNIRTRKTRELYEAGKAKSLEPKQVQDIIDEAMTIRTQVGTESRKDIDNFINRLRQKTGKDTYSPVTSIAVLEDEFKNIRQSLKLPKGSEGAINAAPSQVGRLNEMLNNAIKTNPDMKAAKLKYQEATPAVVRVVDESGIGAIERTSDPMRIIDVVTNPQTATKESVAIISKQLNKQDKQVFPKIARHWMDTASEKALTITTKGEAPLSAGVKFVRAVRGSKGSNKEQIMNQVLEGVANAKGVDATKMKKGFNNMLDVLQRTNLIDAFGSPTATRQATAEAIGETAPLLSKALQLEITSPLRMIGTSMQRASIKRSYKQIAEAMVADDAVNAIMRLALLDPKSRQAQNLVANIINPVRETGQAIENVYTAPTGEEYGITGGGTTASLLGE